MSAPTINFDDGAVYERMMGKWSALTGRAFIAVSYTHLTLPTILRV